MRQTSQEQLKLSLWKKIFRIWTADFLRAGVTAGVTAQVEDRNRRSLGFTKILRPCLTQLHAHCDYKQAMRLQFAECVIKTGNRRLGKRVRDACVDCAELTQLLRFRVCFRFHLTGGWKIEIR